MKKHYLYRGIIAFLLTTILVAGMCVPAFAESGPAEPGTEPDTVLSGEEGDVGDGIEGDGAEDDPVEEDLSETGSLSEEEGAVEESYGFPGMPAGYKLSAAERGKKARLTEKGVVESFDETISGEDYVEGEVVFLTDSRDFAEAVAGAYGGELENFSFGVAIVSLPEDVSTFDAIEAAADLDNNLPAVYPNFIYSLIIPVKETPRVSNGGMSAFSTNIAPVKPVWSGGPGGTIQDTYLQNPNAGTDGYQWFHDAIGTYAAWGGASMGAGVANAIGTGVKVAVIDTGVQNNHPDIGNVAGTGTNTSGNGLGATNTNDDAGHGTHVAGIIAANANNIGGRGVAPGATIVPVKVLNASGSGNTASISAGINWVAGINDSTNPAGIRRADIINMSLGGFDFDDAFDAVVQTAISKGIVVVAAAGNDGTNNYRTPAAFPNVINVAATDMNGLRASFSNYGPQITISAPGFEILSTFPQSITPVPDNGENPPADGQSGYAVLSGTSMASPVVAGAIALYLSNQSTKPSSAAGVTQVKNVIVNLATKANSPSIGKIVNVGNMFNSMTTFPTFTVKDGTGVPVQDLKGLIPGNGTVTISGSNFIVYTTNGKNPAVSNGIVTSGIGIDSSNTVIDLIDFPVGKLTIKAFCVNEQGIASKVATLTITTINVTLGGGAGNPTGGMSPISGPEFLAIGKSATYTAKVTGTAPSGTNKTIVWSIVNKGANTAAIDQKGKLTISQGVPNSTITIRAEAKNTTGTVFSQFQVTVKPLITGLTVQPLAGESTLYANGSQVIPTALKESTQLKLAAMYSGDVSATDRTGITGFATWKSSNTKVATVSADGTVRAVGNGKATITATATDGSKKTGKTTITCVVPVLNVTIGNIRQIAQGTSLTLKATTDPAKPSKGGVTWSISSGSEALGITINSKTGKLTVPKNAALVGQPIAITATANDGYGAVHSMTIAVVASKATKVTIGTSVSYGRTSGKGKTVIQGKSSITNAFKMGNNSNVTAVQLFTLNPPSATEFDVNRNGSSATSSAVDETQIQLSGNAIGNASIGPNFAWSTNKPAIADVDNTGRVTAKGVGSAVITCLALDGSGKKATCTVNVGIPASSLWVQGSRTPAASDDCPTLAYGKSLQMRALSNSAYGKISNTKVAWSIAPEYSGDLKYYKMTSAGKLSVSSSFRNIVGKYGYTYVNVIATALDGSGVSSTKTVYICPGTEKMVMMNQGYRLQCNTSSAFYFYSGFYTADKGKTYQLYGNYFDDYIVTTSNPRVVGVLGSGADSDGDGYVALAGLDRGTSTIKVISNDGTGKYLSFKITVY